MRSGANGTGPALERIGLGPVFIYDWITSSRRWQGYALRAAFLLFLLAALLAMWFKAGIGVKPAIRVLASLGQSFYIAVAGTQLVLVMLAAPAATAGAICLDRARGTLAHMLMTDLSNFEIVLGKLAARLVPVLTVVACTLPLMEVLTLIGGIDPAALWGAFTVSVGVAVLGCALALFFSLWVGKTHEALLATYAVWCLWLLAGPMIGLVASTIGWSLPAPAKTADPFFLVLAPYLWPGQVTWSHYFWFSAVTGAISVSLVVLSILRIRAVCTRESVRRPSRVLSELRQQNLWRLLAQRLPWVSPSLEGNPVLWREWHRHRPSRCARGIMAIYVGLSLFFSILTVVWGGRPALFVNGFQVAAGLLLLSVTASTSLAEERARGSLDLIMSTPLATREIVLGKWLGAYRVVPLLAILPTFVCGALAYQSDGGPWWAVGMFVYMLCAGAAVTSLGLAMATWFSRPARAVSLTVTLYVLVTVGWFFLMLALFHAQGELVGMASPFMWAAAMTFEAGNLGPGNHRGVGWGIAWTFVAAIFAAKTLGFTLCSFDRRLGRVEEVATLLGRPSRSMRVVHALYLVCALLLCVMVQDWAMEPAIPSLQFTLGTIVVAGTAAASLSRLPEYGGSRAGLYSELSPGRIVFVRWASAIRQMWPAYLIPLVLVSFAVGPEQMSWGAVVLLAGYMLASSAAAASLGVALAVLSGRRGRPVLHSIIMCALVNLIGFAVLGTAGDNLLARGLAMCSPIVGVGSLVMAIGGRAGGFAGSIEWAIVWTIGFSIIAAILLARSMVRTSRAIGSLSTGRGEFFADETANAVRTGTSAIGGPIVPS
jgi:ABC-type transport system involved in multi-copper enzyme maturation permease subunit